MRDHLLGWPPAMDLIDAPSESRSEKRTPSAPRLTAQEEAIRRAQDDRENQEMSIMWKASPFGFMVGVQSGVIQVFRVGGTLSGWSSFESKSQPMFQAPWDQKDYGSACIVRSYGGVSTEVQLSFASEPVSYDGVDSTPQEWTDIGSEIWLP